MAKVLTLSVHEIAKDIAESKLPDFKSALQQARAAESDKRATRTADSSFDTAGDANKPR